MCLTREAKRLERMEEKQGRGMQGKARERERKENKSTATSREYIKYDPERNDKTS